MRFLIDAMFPRSFAIALRAQGLEAQHVRGLGPKTLSDAAIWQLLVRRKQCWFRKTTILSNKPNLMIAQGSCGTGLAMPITVNCLRVSKRGRQKFWRG